MSLCKCFENIPDDPPMPFPNGAGPGVHQPWCPLSEPAHAPSVQGFLDRTGLPPIYPPVETVAEADRKESDALAQTQRWVEARREMQRVNRQQLERMKELIATMEVRNEQFSLGKFHVDLMGDYLEDLKLWRTGL